MTENKKPDLKAAAARALAEAEARKAAQQAEKQARKTEAAAIKEKIVAEAESLIDSVAWKVTTARLKELLDEGLLTMKEYESKRKLILNEI